jgi:pimeloyl-ACP methyl ester carboxylesterase
LAPTGREVVDDMAIDEKLLRAHLRFEDGGSGLCEEFLQPELGGARTVAVLSRSRRLDRELGWVVCHSFGIEQIHLGRLEVAVARALATAGYPVLRYHGPGYGDSHAEASAVSVASHLAAAADAVAELARRARVGSVGVLGARFGGTVAALTADRLGLRAVALWEPVVRGELYMREFLRRPVFSELTGRPSAGASTVDRYRRELAEEGRTDINGFLLSREAHDEVSAIDLIADLRRFRGRALLVAVSRSGAPGPGTGRLAQHLRGLGAQVAVEAVRDAGAGQFGEFHYRPNADRSGKVDTQLDLTRAVAGATLRWCDGIESATGPSP